MTARTWLYGALVEATESEVSGRVFAKKTMTSSIERHPYIVYKLGYSTDYELSETKPVNRQFAQVWIHDYHDKDVADYMRIDNIITLIRSSLNNASSAEDGVISCKYLETSQDLNDDTLNTIFRYVRLQLITDKE